MQAQVIYDDTIFRMHELNTIRHEAEERKVVESLRKLESQGIKVIPASQVGAELSKLFLEM